MSLSPRPPVRPRVLSSHSREPLLLADVLEPILGQAEAGAICLSGPPGSGKSAALEALRTSLPSHLMIELLENPDRSRVADLAERMIVIYTASGPHDLPHLANLTLAPWGLDEGLEYLMSVHPERCASVMGRLRAPGGPDLPDLPGLLAVALDRMAEDEAIPDVDGALRRHLDRILPGRLRLRARRICYVKAVRSDARGVDEVLLWGHRGFLGFLMGAGLPAPEIGFIRDPRIQLLLAAERLVDPADGAVHLEGLQRRLAPTLLALGGRNLSGHPEAQARLEDRLRPEPRFQAMGASLLHAARAGWRPPAGGTLRSFRGAHFPKARWSGLCLPDADFSEADLSGADLSGATLDRGAFVDADLRRARLPESSLSRIDAAGADFSGADLCEAGALEASFLHATLEGANLEGACLRDARLVWSNLSRARCHRADLSRASFQVRLPDGPWLEGSFKETLQTMKDSQYRVPDLEAVPTEFQDTDFTEADLQQANLRFADLRTARLDRALLREADLRQCRLDGVTILGGRFEGARLTGAALTGSVMPEADFRKAHLPSARLAEVEWERADLREADLRNASFHLGTSRSGRVFGEPSEGTRTGFYTDDFHDLRFRPPEEIRLANLRGADLRGAHLEGTDFYLVDLRDARYTREQEAHLRRSGALLSPRG